MKILTYQGLPVVRPRKALAEQFLDCSCCHEPVIWVRDREGAIQPRCIDPNCTSNISHSWDEWRAQLEAQREKWLADSKRSQLVFRVQLAVMLFVGGAAMAGMLLAGGSNHGRCCDRSRFGVWVSAPIHGGNWQERVTSTQTAGAQASAEDAG